MKGNTPTIFTGDRSLSNKFLREFRIYQMANRENPAMNVALDCIGIAISYIHRPNVDDWVEHMLNQIDQYIASGVCLQDERLWNMFKQTFAQSFTDTTKKQSAHQKLMHLKMKPNSLDDYIAEFKHLCEEAEWGHDDAGTIMLFKNRLTLGLHHAVLEKVTLCPTNLNRWEAGACTQDALWAKVKASLGGAPLKVTQAEGQKWRNVLGKPCNEKGRWYGVKKEDRMDVDIIKVNTLSIEEQNQLQKEGKCFNCQKVGHISKNCPNKRDTPKNGMLCTNQGMMLQFIHFTLTFLTADHDMLDDYDTALTHGMPGIPF